MTRIHRVIPLALSVAEGSEPEGESRDLLVRGYYFENKPMTFPSGSLNSAIPLSAEKCRPNLLQRTSFFAEGVPYFPFTSSWKRGWLRSEFRKASLPIHSR